MPAAIINLNTYREQQRTLRMLGPDLFERLLVFELMYLNPTLASALTAKIYDGTTTLSQAAREARSWLATQ